MESFTSNPVLVVETRSGIVENRHTGVVCCVQCTAEGGRSIIYSLGDVDQVFYPRSCLKYVQVLPLLESGAAEHFGFSDEEIAVMCSSHNSEPCHLETVRRILSKAGIDECSLRCGGHTPVSEAAAFAYVRDGAPTPFVDHIYNNCSGKHAGFLALCKYLHLPLDGYLDPSHEVQVLVREVVCDVFEMDETGLHVGVDGCSAPNYAMTARQAAIGYARLSHPADHFQNNPTRLAAISRMIRCITMNAYMVYGENGYCTALMREMCGSVIGKRGAGGVYMTGVVGQGVGCAVKIDGGVMGPQYCVAQSFLHWYRVKYGCFCTNTGADTTRCEECLPCEEKMNRLSSFMDVPVLNAMSSVVGNIKCNSLVFKNADSSPSLR